ncbi:hypothetical protein EW026_g3805 [Hermanssonia centrifuga]|uniref:DH domain-containing protein n=1 Tax=Hermanssonia centrifuga TaxID=98765 RepID=A0A4V3XAJ7_9APHY|nr:hypothetical protein EW026_g3805 [Hermanssonia centrifuga]
MDAKPLPPPARDDRLPPLPPSHYDNSATGWDVSPPPPPKHSLDREYETSQYNTRGHNLPDIHSSALSPHDGFDVPPITPISPVGSTPSSPSGAPRARKKVNPLTDLIETEKVYVDLLTGIIRKVAAAWSRSNLPPPELDTMFRSVESVYKANRSLLSKLKEIGANPSSPKVLGDLLMRWIDDLEAPYTKYATNYCAGFDEWDPVQSNTRLRTTLAIFSSSNPPPLPSSSPEHPPEPPLWTLDDLFLLPKGRLGYYRKLYSRLLKSTVPGRSDHRLLSGALDKLDNLLVTLDERAIIKVGANTQAPQDTEDEVVFDMRTRQSTVPLNSQTQRESDSTHGSGSIANELSQETPPTSVERTSTATMSIPITDLERRLSTEQTLDIFTMQPKQVRLQIAPPTLHYTRDLRICADVVMTFTPRSTGVDVTHERGRIFVLTDLLLMCERMTPQEAARFTPDGPDMWLLYPPLAGKHLRVVPVDGSDNAFTVTILRKEIVTITPEYVEYLSEPSILTKQFPSPYAVTSWIRQYEHL